MGTFITVNLLNYLIKELLCKHNCEHARLLVGCTSTWTVSLVLNGDLYLHFHLDVLPCCYQFIQCLLGVLHVAAVLPVDQQSGEGDDGENVLISTNRCSSSVLTGSHKCGSRNLKPAISCEGAWLRRAEHVKKTCGPLM